MSPNASPKRVLMFEVNEISWSIMEPYMKEGKLPHFRKLKEEGASATTFADEPTGLLDPWITWTTLFTGVPQPEHGVVFLEQPPESIKAKRLWDIVDEAGKKVGVFGSAGTWPPKKVEGFFIPGSFSPDSRTYPDRLKPIQDLNLRYTRAHAPGARQPGLMYAAKSVLELMKLGLDSATLFNIVRILAEVKLYPDREWKKVSLQPVVNLAFFHKLLKDSRPDFSTFHTNHVAHYQHRFYRAMRPDLFEDKTDAAEITRFKDAILYGYEVADQALAGLMALCDEDPDLVLCVASSMGQQPFLPDRHGKVAPETCRIKSIEKILSIAGLDGKCEYFSTMAPQWNLRIPDGVVMEKAIRDLTAARYMPLDQPMFSAMKVDDAIVLTPISRHNLDDSVKCSFPTLNRTFAFEELIIQADETRKSGCHHPVGLLAFFGKSVRAGHSMGELNNLDVAPTLLDLMGVDIPSNLKGKVLSPQILLSPAASSPTLAAVA